LLRQKGQSNIMQRRRVEGVPYVFHSSTTTFDIGGELSQQRSSKSDEENSNPFDNNFDSRLCYARIPILKPQYKKQQIFSSIEGRFIKIHSKILERCAAQIIFLVVTQRKNLEL
jgi:hypothetical protein